MTTDPTPIQDTKMTYLILTRDIMMTDLIPIQDTMMTAPIPTPNITMMDPILTQDIMMTYLILMMVLPILKNLMTTVHLPVILQMSLLQRKLLQRAAVMMTAGIRIRVQILNEAVENERLRM